MFIINYTASKSKLTLKDFFWTINDSHFGMIYKAFGFFLEKIGFNSSFFNLRPS